MPRGVFNQHTNLESLIWPEGLPPDQHLGEFIHVSQQHPNAAFLGVLLADCTVNRIRRTELTFPVWRLSQVEVGQ